MANGYKGEDYLTPPKARGYDRLKATDEEKDEAMFWRAKEYGIRPWASERIKDPNESGPIINPSDRSYENKQDPLMPWLTKVGKGLSSAAEYATTIPGQILEDAGWFGSEETTKDAVDNVTRGVSELSDDDTSLMAETAKDVTANTFKEPKMTTGAEDLISSKTPSWFDKLSNYEKFKLFALGGEALGDIASYGPKMTAAIGDIQARGALGLTPGSAIDPIKEVGPSSFAPDIAEMFAESERKKEKAKFQKVLDKLVGIGGEDDVPEYGGEDDIWDHGIAEDIANRALASNPEMTDEDVLRIRKAIKENDPNFKFDSKAQMEEYLKRDKQVPEQKRFTLVQQQELNPKPFRVEILNNPETKRMRDANRDVLDSEQIDIDGTFAKTPGEVREFNRKADDATEFDYRSVTDAGDEILKKIEQLDRGDVNVKVAAPSASPSDALTKIAAAMSISDKLDFLDDRKENKKVKELEKQVQALKQQQRAQEDVEWMKLQQQKLKDSQIIPTQITPIRWR